MKKLAVILLITISPMLTYAHYYTSVFGGGSWGTAATWAGGPVGTTPGSTDTAIIASHVTENALYSVLRVVINSGETLTLNQSINVYGEIVNNGTLYTPSGYNINLRNSNATVMAGHGIYNMGAGGDILFYSVGQIIDSTVYWPSYGNILLYTAFNKVSVINKGKMYFNGCWLENIPASYPSSWTNANNSVLYLTKSSSVTSLGNSFDTLHASAPGDTVWFYGINISYTIKQPVNSQYCNLILYSWGTGIDNIPSNLSLNLLYVYSGAKVNLNGYNMNLTGNWADYGTISNNTGMTTFDAKGSQCILRTSGTESFKNMTITRTSKLGSNCTVSASGTVFLQPGGSMDCTCP
jgi:hypothetical protein